MSEFELSKDPIFAEIKATTYPPDAVVSQQLREFLVELDKHPNDTQRSLGLMASMAPMAAWAITELEKQLIALRREVRGV
ncbi:hypothetical protein [Mycolicibacter hiberniae]|uniref:Uncharacterized protein n=1 Tax=Mycolicibacter hiberniae TaxID=29314 RepID=A0A7I7X0M7_9MYCO|nr:hypothetical protein [Mycolicibacter hiberniae]MCV7085809.1 hypothetical protein [Mycolicibacter hiberniae]ORV73225.1 hypothetical protein AWC09_00045 [Mycolicibacter hiberniae]BBZ22830.1 hypothetical protein MHIB_12480 [Mycolicibacter hiberniae]